MEVPGAMAWVVPLMTTPIENGPRRLSVNVTEKTKLVAVVPVLGLTLPPERVLVCPPPLVHVGAASTVAANGALKPSTIVTINDGTSMPSSGPTAG